MSDVTPARIGLLIDYLDDEGGFDENILPSLQLVADEYVEQGILERPVEFVVRAVQGLPNGSFRAVRDAFFELVEQDSLVIFGPWVSENGAALSRYVEDLGEVACITMAATETMLGEWVFGLPAGSMEEEPIIMATVAALDGCRSVGIAFEDSLIGTEYLRTTRVACADAGLRITAEVPIPQVQSEKATAMATLAADKPDAVMHVGFGLGIPGMNDALREIGWLPPRYTTTAFEFASTSRMVARTTRRLDRARPVRRAQRGRRAISGPVRSPPRTQAGVLLPGVLLRRRPPDDDRAGQCPPADGRRGQAGAGEDQDASRRDRRAWDATAVRPVHPARLGRQRVPGCPPRPARRQRHRPARHHRGPARTSRAAMTIRVVQWATGAVGTAQLREVIDRPDLELVGLFVYSPSKVGVDAGALVDRPPTGVLATNDASAILALDADVVLHAASKAFPDNTNTDDIVALLESGKSVITTTSYNHLPTFGADVDERINRACAEAGTRFHAAGEHPGFMFERLATSLTALSQRVDKITVSRVRRLPGGHGARDARRSDGHG